MSERHEAYWEAQHAWNDKVDIKLEAHDERIVTIEKRLIWIVAAAACGGASIGSGLGGFLAKMIGL